MTGLVTHWWCLDGRLVIDWHLHFERCLPVPVFLCPGGAFWVFPLTTAYETRETHCVCRNMYKKYHGYGDLATYWCFQWKILTLYEPMCIGTLTLNLSGVSQIGDPWFAGFCRKGVFECGNWLLRSAYAVTLKSHSPNNMNEEDTQDFIQKYLNIANSRDVGSRDHRISLW